MSRNVNGRRKYLSFFTFSLLPISKHVTGFRENSHMFLTAVRDCKRYLLQICARPKKVQVKKFIFSKKRTVYVHKTTKPFVRTFQHFAFTSELSQRTSGSTFQEQPCMASYAV